MDVTPAIWEAVSTLLDEALDLDAEARVAWIEHIDAAHPELAPLLRRLLAAHASSETAGRALEATAALREATLILDAHGMSADRALLGQTRLGIHAPASLRR